MARIRSIHPGLATDEAYMSMSMTAKAAWPLLWTECDDQGAFEWKPIVLKARLFPADNVDFEEILKELEQLKCITRYSMNGKDYALVRNFKRFQRPKKPNSVHPIPAELVTSSPLVPNQFPTGGGKSPQMEDGGWRMEEGDIHKHSTSVVEPTVPSPSELSGDLEKRLRKAAGWEAATIRGLSSVGPIVALLEAGASLELDVLPTVAATAHKADTKTWKFFLHGIRRAWEDRVTAGKPLAEKTEATKAIRKAAAIRAIEEHNAQVERERKSANGTH